MWNLSEFQVYVAGSREAIAWAIRMIWTEMKSITKWKSVKMVSLSKSTKLIGKSESKIKMRSSINVQVKIGSKHYRDIYYYIRNAISNACESDTKRWQREKIICFITF